MDTQNEIVVYGTTWCGDTIRARRVLDKRKVSYKWVDINQDSEGRAYVMEVNNGNRSVPTILFADGSILVEPSNAELNEKLDQLT